MNVKLEASQQINGQKKADLHVFLAQIEILFQVFLLQAGEHASVHQMHAERVVQLTEAYFFQPCVAQPFVVYFTKLLVFAA